MKKRFLLFTSMLICMLFVTKGIQAGDSYWYARLTVTTNPASDAGMVYADRFRIDEEGATRTYEANSFTGEGRATSKGGDGTFHAYAKPNRGYVFDHWDNAGDVSVTESEITVTRKVYNGDDGKDNSSKYTEYNDLVAYFTANAPIEGGVTYNAADGGTYKVDYDLLEAEEDPVVPVNSFLTYNTDVITLTATLNSGYNFKGWKRDGVLVSYMNPWQTSFDASATIEPVFEEGQPNFKVDGVTFTTLNEAITFAQSEFCTAPVVAVNQNCTVSEGDYTIPSGVTLLVPFDAANTCFKKLKIGYDYEPYASAWSTPSVYRTLTLASGAHIIANGDISVSATMCWSMGNNGSPCGKYGFIKMNSGSTITLNGGSNLYAWGYISGEGIITAKPGSNTYEGFQVTGYRGGNATSGMADNPYKVFPMNQYYIQNIENKIVFEAGALEHLFMGVTSGWGDEGASIDFIGGPSSTNTLFLLKSGATLTKWYDASNDRQKYELSGNAELDQIVLDIASVSSKDYVLPLTNNLDLDILSGTTSINFDVAIFPDVNIHIRQGATIDIKKNVYVYDADEWDPAYAYAKFTNNDKNTQGAITFANVVRPIAYTTTTKFSRTSVSDANIVVDGTLNVGEGAKLYTTISGANITGHGEVHLVSANSANDMTYQAVQSTTGSANTIHHYQAIEVTPAQLRNADGTYTQTAGFVNSIFEYQTDRWVLIQAEEKVELEDAELTINDELAEEIQDIIDTLHVHDGGILTITATENTVQPVVVENGGTIVVPEGKTVDVESIELNTCPADINNAAGTVGQSSQVTGNGAINANSDIYLDIKMHPSGNMNYLLWYTFAVPFNVAINGGIEKLDYKGNATPAVSDVDYRCYTYDGEARAAGNLDNAWVQVTSSTDGGYFVPGKFYLVEFNSNAYNTFRFHKASGEDVNNAQHLSLAYNASTTGDEKDGGWNAIANTALKSAQITISDGTLVAQIFNPVKRKFETIVLSETTLALGVTLFVQVSEAAVANNSVVSTPSPIVARRSKAAEEDKTYGVYQLRISQSENTFDDQLLFSATTKTKDTYKAGKDLTKMFMGNSTVAQMWINDYDAKLTMNEMPMKNGVAAASMTIYAPVADEYELCLKSIPEDVTIYLTKDGIAVWNLCVEGYKASLNQGENEGYGILVVSKAPQVATGIEEAIADTKENDTRKVLIDGHVYIIRGKKAYTVEGHSVNN